MNEDGTAYIDKASTKSSHLELKDESGNDYILNVSKMAVNKISKISENR